MMSQKFKHLIDEYPAGSVEEELFDTEYMHSVIENCSLNEELRTKLLSLINEKITELELKIY